MSTRYNTRNPIESTDVRDMSDNAKNFDDFANSKSNEFTDRFGVERKTIHGMNSQFDSHIMNMGFTRVGTFAAGATLTNTRQTLLWDVADGGDGQEYGWSGTFSKIVPPGSTPNTTGGIAVGAWMSRFDPELKVQVREALRRSYAEAGYKLVAGSFEVGGKLVNANDVLLHEASGKAFSGPAGTVAAGTNPASGGFVDVSGVTLYSTLSDVNIANYANAFYGSDDTDALTRFLTDSVLRGGGIARAGAVYTITRPISITVPPDTDVQIDMRGSVIRYITPLGADQRIYPLTFAAANHSTNTGVELLNIAIDCDVPYFESITPTDRRGIGGVMFSNIDRPKVNGWRGRNMFYSAGIMARFFNSADFQNVLMEDVGSKYRPNADDTSDYDAAGDAVHLLDAVGVASTSIRNIKAKSYDGKIGRAGIVCEELTSGITSSHSVTIENGNFDGYQRITHQEDNGKSTIVWSGGSAERFSNLTYHLSSADVGDRCVAEVSGVSINVNPPLRYGGTSGVSNLQGNGRSAYNDCDIRYTGISDVQDRGSCTYTRCAVDLGGIYLFHVPRVDVTYDGCKFTALAGAKLLRWAGGQLVFRNKTKLSDNMKVHVEGSPASMASLCIYDTRIGAAGLIIVNTRAYPVEISRSELLPVSGADLLNSSSDCVVKWSECTIVGQSDSEFTFVYGDSSVDSSYYDCELVNMIPIFMNGNRAADGSDILQMVGCKLIAKGTVAGRSFMNLFSAAVIAQSNLFIDKTAGQVMTVPATAGRVVTSGTGNVLSKDSGVTVL